LIEKKPKNVKLFKIIINNLIPDVQTYFMATKNRQQKETDSIQTIRKRNNELGHSGSAEEFLTDIKIS
jgi:hypothetical protein